MPNSRGLADWKTTLARWFSTRFALGVLLCLLLALLIAVRGRAVVRSDHTTSLMAALAQKGLRVSPRQTVWLRPHAGGLSTRPVLFLANASGELDDLYYADVRTAGDGGVLDVFWLTNVSRTSSAAEQSLVSAGQYVAYALKLGNTYDAVAILNTRGESPALTAQWPWHARLQNLITNLQECGRGHGFGRQRYQLVPPAMNLRIEVRDGRFVVQADDDRVVIDPALDKPVAGQGRVQRQPMVKSRPGSITWVVDTMRNSSWVGPTFVEWLEHTVFGITDKAERLYRGLVGTDTEAEVRQALSMPEVEPEPVSPQVELERVQLLTAAAPDLAWPPPPLQPLLPEQVRGEGQWMPVVDRSFVNAYPNAPPAFYQTFIRVDPEREYARVYITLWDPRQVQLHIAMGTREPESATGKTGSGMIPRDPELLRHLVGAFNGGFQALHGEFGMMSDGQVYLPPKPWAATVAVFKDGRVGMGSWPGPGRREWDEEFANRQIPEDMVSMRQNLTSVVEDGVYNPWKRWWWGAAPPWAEEQTYIYRSGICLTQEGFLAFFWGEAMGPEELGRSMLAVRCRRGMHLDMNSKHTGFEFYKPFARGHMRPLGRRLSDAEFEGEIPDCPDMVFRARKAVTTMSPLRFPRYLSMDPRDFFYLTLKPVLPGPDLRLGAKSVGFSTKGLPNAGWPHAFARAKWVDDHSGERTWLVRIDPSRGLLRTVADDPSERALAYLSGVKLGARGEPPVQKLRRRGGARGKHYALVSRPGRVGRVYAVARPGREDQVLLQGPLLSKLSGSAAAIGVDENGFLVYAERDPYAEGELLQPLRLAGVHRAVALPEGARLAFVIRDMPISVDGLHRLQATPEASVAVVAERRPAAEVIFPDTEPRPYRKWGWLQGKRVRYFPTGKPRFPTPENAK